MTRAPVSHQESIKAGVIPHYCCVCDAPNAGHGLGPPARAEEIWFCSVHAPEHLRHGRATPGPVTQMTPLVAQNSARRPASDGQADLFGRAAA